MPAERTRGSKRGSDSIESTWAVSIDVPKLQSIAFAPNVTPGTFNDPPSPVDSSVDSMLFPPTPESPSGKRHAHSKKKPENHIPRPPNAFILFRSSFINNKHVSSDVETNHSTLSKIIGLTWHNLPHEERQVWHAKAKIALEEHRRKYPQYAFRPLHTKTKGGAEKRKVREVGPKDMKRCARIAELLAQGLKGDELNKAIAEFDRTHVPEIVTRFEAPITARTYRRSSSAPVPDTEHSNPVFLKDSASKLRALSTEPGSLKQGSPLNLQIPALSQGDVTANEFQDDFPASPVAVSPTYTLPDTNPSFDFSTFSFNNTAPPANSETYNALFSNSQESLFDPFSSQVTDTPCTPLNDTFAPSPIADASYLSYASSSPLSSVPSTPQTYAHMQTSAVPAMSSDAMSMPMLNTYDLSFEFATGVSNYLGGMVPQPVPTNPAIYDTHHYGMAPKVDYSWYAKSEFASLEHTFSAPYLSAVSAYGM